MTDDHDPLQKLADDEERLRHADRLAILGRLAAGVAHELGTPLSAIRLHAQLIATGEVDDAAEVRDGAQAVVDQCDRMSGLLRRLLDVARPHRGAPAPLDLGPLARATLDLVRPLARKQGVTLAAPPPGASARVVAVRGEVQQVLLNLVINALQALDGPGRVEVSVHTAGDRAELVVADDGPGVDVDDLERLFEPFFTTKEDDVGTGLGLTVVREIVEGAGGTLQVRPTDPGLTFTVGWPSLV